MPRKKPNIIVIGSTNTDLVIKTPRLPQPGETVTGGEFYTAAGGKGANQAVAAARAGANVTFIGCVGDDDFGHKTLHTLRTEGINCEHIKIAPGLHSGVAFILVDEKGDNLISVAPGANNKLLPGDILKINSTIATADFLLLQLEIPLSTVKTSIELAHQSNTPILLNPAPARHLSPEILRHVDYLTPNEHELSILTAQKSNTIEQEIAAVRELGVKHVIVTRGERGVLLINDDYHKSFPAPRVTAIDTVGAGDCFCGNLAVALSEGQALDSAINFAQHAAALAVTKKGAQPSLPFRNDVEKLVNN